MEIRYIRKLMASYMIMDAQKSELNEWEQKMISHVHIAGILFPESSQEDGDSSLWYDITGKMSLDVALQERQLDYMLLSRIFMGIYDVVERVENMLLRSEHILLLPETIFLDYALQEVYLCFYPTKVELVQNDFGSLVEYMMERLDHGDERAVELLYGIYEQVSKGGWSLRDLKRLLCLSYEKEDGEVDDAIEEETLVYEEVEVSDVETPLLPVQMKWYEKLRKNITESIQKITSLTKGKLIKDEQIKEEKQRFVYQPDEDDAEVYTARPTMLLKEINRPIAGILRYEGEGNCKDIHIEKDECVIGSDISCNGYVPSGTVSRKHAKITRVNDIYFIEDLNSSNGTYVGGELLSYKTKISLQKNEIVLLADEKFRFI